MIVRVNGAHWSAGHALRLAGEFGFDLIWQDNSHVWFGAKEPTERYADWFIEGLQAYNFRSEVETWEPLQDPNPAPSGAGDTSLTSDLPSSPLTATLS